jgi:hypothetical protein
MALNSQYIDKFIGEFIDFIAKLHSIKPTLETQSFTQNVNTLDKMEIVNMCETSVLPVRDRIISKDETLFEKKYLIIKTINVSYFWKYGTHEQRESIWISLKRIVIYCKLIFNIVDNPTPQPIQSTQTIPQSSEFNPYIGTGTGATPTLSVNSMLQSVEQLGGSSGANGNGAMVDMLLSQMGVNGSDVSEKLKNIDEGLLSQVPDMIQGMLGGQSDPAMKSMLTEMVKGVGTELKTTDITKGNMMENLFGVAQKLSQKFATDVSNGADLPIDKLVASTQNLMKNMGLPQNANEINPVQLMGMLANLSNMQMPQTDKSSTS